MGDNFATRDAQAFQRCFVAFVAALTKTPGEGIAIDGKTSRRSYQKKGSKMPIHMVPAFAARQRLLLGQVKANKKSNQIAAIPALLDMIEIEGAIVTMDAILCRAARSPRISRTDEPITFSRSSAIRGRFWTTSKSSWTSKKLIISRIRRSAGMRPPTAIMA